jgi:hypothetical protein
VWLYWWGGCKQGQWEVGEFCRVVVMVGVVVSVSGEVGSFLG